MKFTKQKPTKPGFYWIRERFVSTIKSIVELSGHPMRVSFFRDGYSPQLQHTDHILWGDKIEVPEE